MCICFSMCLRVCVCVYVRSTLWLEQNRPGLSWGLQGRGGKQRSTYLLAGKGTGRPDGPLGEQVPATVVIAGSSLGAL